MVLIGALFRSLAGRGVRDGLRGLLQLESGGGSGAAQGSKVTDLRGNITASR